MWTSLLRCPSWNPVHEPSSRGADGGASERQPGWRFGRVQRLHSQRWYCSAFTPLTPQDDRSLVSAAGCFLRRQELMTAVYRPASLKQSSSQTLSSWNNILCLHCDKQLYLKIRLQMRIFSRRISGINSNPSQFGLVFGYKTTKISFISSLIKFKNLKQQPVEYIINETEGNIHQNRLHSSVTQSIMGTVVLKLKVGLLFRRNRKLKGKIK